MGAIPPRTVADCDTLLAYWTEFARVAVTPHARGLAEDRIDALLDTRLRLTAEDTLLTGRG